MQKRGISLIVLVITIIVMIILAATIIISLNNTGIIGNASMAKDMTDEKTIDEMVQVTWLDGKSKKFTGDALRKYVMDNLKNVIPEEKMTDYRISVTDRLASVAKITTKVSDEWKASVTKLIGEVPIPNGFYYVGGTKNDGLVISDVQSDEDKGVSSVLSGNQYVWVPVDDFSEFIRKDNLNKYYYKISNTIGGKAWWEIDPSTSLDETYMTQYDLDEVTAMYNSVKKYGGFYIARFEAGIDSPRISSKEELVMGANVKSQMNKYVYNYVGWSSERTMNVNTGGAVEVSRSIYPNNDSNSTGVISTLMYGVQWDTVIQWLLNTREVTNLNDSTDYGNYKDHLVLASEINEGAKYQRYKDEYRILTDAKYISCCLHTTGALKSSSTNNIYDLAGNVQEWTMEGCDTKYRVSRGGSYFRNGRAYPDDSGRTEVWYPISNRHYCTSRHAIYDEWDPPDSWPYTGFRFTLYIK